MCRPWSLAALIQPHEYDALTLWHVPDHLDPHHAYNDLYAGLDVGRTHDLTVLWIVEQYVNVDATGEWDRYDYKTVAVKSIRNQPIPTQYAMLSPLIAHPQVRSIAIDQGTVGRTLSDMILQDHPDRARPVNFSNPYKAKLAEQLKGYVQAQRLSMPKDDDLIRTDILSLKREASAGGYVTYNGRTSTTHCDFFWAAGMALDAAIEATGTGIQMVSLN